MGFRGSEPATVGQGLVQRKTNEIRVLTRIPNDSPPMGIIEIADNVFRRKIAEQSCLRRSIGRFVNKQVSKRTPSTLCVASACEETSITTCVMPRSTIMRK